MRPNTKRGLPVPAEDSGDEVLMLEWEHVGGSPKEVLQSSAQRVIDEMDEESVIMSPPPAMLTRATGTRRPRRVGQ